jgi:hypothetical protein
VLKQLEEIPANSKVIIDCSRSKAIAHDVLEVIKDFEVNAKSKNIIIEKPNFIEPAYL